MRGESKVDLVRFVAMWQRVIDLENRYFDGPLSRSAVYWSNALAGEAGEVCNATKHRAGGGTHVVVVPNEELHDELADAFAYLVVIAERLKWSPSGFYEVMLAFNKSAFTRVRVDCDRGEISLSNALAADVGLVCDATTSGQDVLMERWRGCEDRLPIVAVRIIDLMVYSASQQFVWRTDPMNLGLDILFDAMAKNAAKTVQRMEARAGSGIPT